MGQQGGDGISLRPIRPIASPGIPEHGSIWGIIVKVVSGVKRLQKSGAGILAGFLAEGGWGVGSFTTIFSM